MKSRISLALCTIAGSLLVPIGAAPAAGATSTPIPELAYAQLDFNSHATPLTGSLHVITNVNGTVNDAALPVGVPVTGDIAMDAGGQIAFTSVTADGTPQVYVVNSDGSGLRSVTPVGYRNPAWSPDGTKLAVEQADDLISAGSGVAVVDLMDADTLTPIPFAATSPAQEAVNGAPVWSPDGSRLAFYAFASQPATPPSGPTDGWVDIASADATGTVALASTASWPGGTGNRLVAWSPDGSRISFVAEVPGSLPTAVPTTDLCTVPADGSGGITPPQPGPYADFGSLSYSPDGSKLAYGILTPSPEFVVKNADLTGGDLVPTTIPGWPQGGIPSFDVTWAPDSEHVVVRVGVDTYDQNGQAIEHDDAYALGLADASLTRLTTSGQASAPAVAPRVVRYAGASRIETSISLSRQKQNASTVLIARSDLYPDALAAAPLAKKLGAPVLLSPTSGLTSAVKAEVKRLGATTAYVIGSTDALSAQVETDLRSAGVTTVNRIGGATRYETAAKIAELVGGTHAFVARGDDWPDAASVSQLAATLQQPILLTPKDSLDPNVTQVFDDLHITSATIVGGQAAVTSSVETALNDAGVTTTRLAGADRYATSIAVASQLPGAATDAGVTLANGRNWPDAIAAGASATHPMVLVDPVTLANSPAAQAWLQSRSTSLVVAVGGPQAVSPADAAEALTRPFG